MRDLLVNPILKDILFNLTAEVMVQLLKAVDQPLRILFSVQLLAVKRKLLLNNRLVHLLKLEVHVFDPLLDSLRVLLLLRLDLDLLRQLVCMPLAAMRLLSIVHVLLLFNLLVSLLVNLLLLYFSELGQLAQFFVAYLLFGI